MTFVYTLDHPHDLPLDQVTALIGGKAANLGVMARELDLPVPPGIVITTAACRAYLAGGWPAGLDEEIRAGLAGVERQVGRRFGDVADPLLVSVRSGAPVSMPGMMDTILDLGLTDATEVGLARASGDPAFARDCHERFRTMFRDIVGQDAPDDPWHQLRLAVEAVFRSWNSDRARAYRQREGIPDDAGTGVTIQAMVFGNRGPDSATGVVFTRNPATGEPGLYGDVMFGAQGEDVVAGTHRTEPLASLDRRLPALAAELRRDGARLEVFYRDLCDIEFTIEDGRLWLLQVRVGKRSPRAALRIALDMALDEGFPLTRREAVERVAPLLGQPPRVATGLRRVEAPLVTGLGASPGLATGEIATDPEAALLVADAGRSAILVRGETSPDDVHGMARAAGILTSRGGLASHAAVVARGWGLPAVVGARDMEVGDGTVRFPGVTLAAGDVISVDGDTGEVFRGAVGGASDIAPEARTLLDWARELGNAVTGPDEPGAGAVAAAPATAASAATAARAATTDDCIQALAVVGMASAEGVARAVGAPAAEIQPFLDRLVADGSVAAPGGTYRLTDAGRARRAELLAAEQAAIGPEEALGALDGLLAFDGRMKAIVTDLQLRQTDAGPVLNDHADAAYDAAVVARLVALHGEAGPWLGSLQPRWPRARRYQARLDAALERAVAGDIRFVASPRVDSYHGAWFELHEDLILLAGRTRADEVGAGRA
ncbi:MAG TPA: pyruvate, phosphate dikinase [Candidatus Sulfotelmatobacter sp.]|nr:pyruvate, phosphate dikinase [Candidatus Sulfotelmatobacter sp.]